MLKKDAILHPIAIAQVMINFAANYGVGLDTCLQGTGIKEEELRDSDALITRSQEMRLIENLILALPDEPALGFKLGMQYNIATFGVFGFALRTSRTMRDAAKRAMQYLPLSTAYCDIYEIDDPLYYGVGMNADVIPPHLRQFLLERDMATALNLMKELNFAGIKVVQVELQGPVLTYAPLIESMAGVALVFERPRNAAFIKQEDVDFPLPMFDSNLVRMLDDQCQKQLTQRKVEGVAGLVRGQLLGPLGLVASLDSVADALAMSPRSLRRKLEQENTRFRVIVEEERRQIALSLLTCSAMKLDELALHLGYTDTASFTRAFRRWMGYSPGEYRKNNTQ